MKTQCIRLIIAIFIIFFVPQSAISFSIVKVGSRYDSWTIEEQKNAVHFMNADKARRKATAILNDRSDLYKLQFDSDYGGMLTYLKLAVSEARLVHNNVLDKIHPQMKINFRLRFQKSCELMIKFFETKDMKFQLQSMHLHNEWVDFWNRNKKDIKIRTYKEKKAWEFWK